MLYKKDKKWIKKLSKFSSWVIFLFFGLIAVSWMRDGKLLNGIDTILPLNLKNFINEYFYIWSNKTAPGVIDVNKLSYFLPLGLSLKLIDLLHIPFSTYCFETILLYILYTGAGLSAYNLYRTVFPSARKITGVIAGAFYMFNFYILFIFTPLPIPLLFSYCFFPFVFSKYISFIENLSIQSCIFFTTVWVLLLNTSYGTPPYLIIHVSIFIAYLLFYIFFINRKELIFRISFVLESFVIWSLLSSYIVLPLLINSSHELSAYSSSNIIESIDIFSLNSTQLSDAFRLMGYFGLNQGFLGILFYPWFSIYKSPLFSLLSYILPTIAFSALVVKKKNNTAYYFFVLLSLGFIFLLKGPNSPFGNLNILIYKLLNLFTIFRTGYQRFTAYIALGFCIMAGYSLNKLLDIKIPKNSYLQKYLIIMIFLSIFIFSFPIWSGSLFTADKKSPSYHISVPNSYYEANNWLENNRSDSNIFPLPFSLAGISNLQWNGYKDGYNGVNPLSLITDSRIILSGSSQSLQAEVARMLTSGDEKAIEILKLLNVQYILLQNDSNWNYINYHNWWISNEQNILKENLSKFRWLNNPKKIGDLWFYRIIDEDLWSHFYVPQEIKLIKDNQPQTLIESLDKKIHEEKIVYISANETAELKNITKIVEINKKSIISSKKINPTKYLLKINNGQEILPIVFSETYHGSWRIYTNDSLFAKPILTKHFVANTFANGWLIDLNEICEKNSEICTKNIDGSINLTLIIKFDQQKTTETYFIISTILIIISSIYLIYKKHAKSYSKKKEDLH